jgi:hypothetical protein
MMSRMALSLMALMVVAACDGSEVTGPTHDAQPGLPSNADRSPTDQSHERSALKVKFEKWFTTYPAMTGNTSYGDGTFSGKVLSRTVSADGVIVHLQALYTITDRRGRSFTAQIEGDQNTVERKAVLEGVVIEGRMLGAHVHVTFDVITSCALATGPSVVGTCFQGIIRVKERQ